MEEEAPVSQSRVAFVSRFFERVDHYKKLLFRFWWIPVITVAAAVQIQKVMLKRIQPVYVSTGRMIVNVKVTDPGHTFYTDDANNFYGTQVALMKSESVKARVFARLQASEPDLHAWPPDISVSVAPKASIFDLRAVGENGRYTQLFLQTTMEEYVKKKKELVDGVANSYLDSMKEEIKTMAVELDKAKEDVINFEASNSVVFLETPGGNSAKDFLAKLNQQLAESTMESNSLETLTLDENLQRIQDLSSKSAMASRGNQTNAPASNSALAGLPSNLGEFEEGYLNAKRELLRLSTRKAELKERKLGPEAHEMVELERDIAREEIALDYFKQQSLAQLANRKHILDLHIQDLKSEIKIYEDKAVDVNKKLLTYQALKENQRRLQTRYDQMQTSYQTTQANKDIGQENVTILEPATTAFPEPPEAMKHLVMAGLIGFLLGIGIMVFIDKLDDRPTTSTELEMLFDKPVLGQFPLMKPENKKLGVPILQPDDDRYPMVEAYRSLRSAFLYRESPGASHPKARPKSIVITSARPNDGKSMVSSNFAVTLAQSGSRVLLIDADLRRGVLHKHFSIPSAPGLAEVLGGQTHWSAAVVPTAIPNLHILPCGESPRQPGHLFATAGKFLTELEGHYDYYLFDTAPVMVGDDVLSLAPQVDGLIMVIRARFTSGRIAQAALDLLHQRRVNVIGLVFNAVNPKTSDYYYYRFKEYYPHEPAEKD